MARAEGSQTQRCVSCSPRPSWPLVPAAANRIQYEARPALMTMIQRFCDCRFCDWGEPSGGRWRATERAGAILREQPDGDGREWARVGESGREWARVGEWAGVGERVGAPHPISDGRPVEVARRGCKPNGPGLAFSLGASKV